jgi:hypothetical protein
MTGEAVKDGGGGGVGEILDAAAGGFGLNAAEAVEAPGCMEEFVEGDGFGGALGIELAGERVEEIGVFLAFVVADDEVARGESVEEGVLRDARFTFVLARSGGMLCVSLLKLSSVSRPRMREGRQ